MQYKVFFKILGYGFIVLVFLGIIAIGFLLFMATKLGFFDGIFEKDRAEMVPVDYKYFNLLSVEKPTDENKKYLLIKSKNEIFKIDVSKYYISNNEPLQTPGKFEKQEKILRDDLMSYYKVLKGGIVDFVPSSIKFINENIFLSAVIKRISPLGAKQYYLVKINYATGESKSIPLHGTIGDVLWDGNMLWYTIHYVDNNELYVLNTSFLTQGDGLG